MTKDFRAVNHVLTHSMDYEKPMEGRKALARFLGDGEFIWVDITFSEVSKPSFICRHPCHRRCVQRSGVSFKLAQLLFVKATCTESR